MLAKVQVSRRTKNYKIERLKILQEKFAAKNSNSQDYSTGKVPSILASFAKNHSNTKAL